MQSLKTKNEYHLALSRLNEIFDAQPGSPQVDELQMLGNLVSKYESIHHPIGAPDPDEAIRFRMEQMGKN